MTHFRFMLEGRDFTLFTDHKPLTFALFRVSLPWTARQQRHLSYLFEFTSDIVHLPGLQNVVADALSCPSPAASALTIEVVQVPGLNPLGDILPGTAPPCKFTLSPPYSLCPLTRPYIFLCSLPHNSPAQKILLFSVTLLSKFSQCPTVNPLSSVTSAQVLLGLWFLFLSVNRFLMLYTTYLTLVYVLPGD